MGVEIPEAASKLRLIAKHGETLQSHLLHLFFLAAPDFVGQPSVISLLESKPEVVELACRLKGLANRMCDVVAGRTTHPTALHVGGVSRMPDREELLAVRDALVRASDDLAATADLFRGFEVPDFARETEFVSLKGDGEYPWIGGRLVSSDGVEKAEHEYLAMTNEYVDDNNTSKWTRLSRESFAVGALARFNNNAHLLLPEAVKVASDLGLAPVSHNPFMNNVAQLVECVHCVHDSIRLIDDLVQDPTAETIVPVTPQAGEGVGAVEVPRGILYHHYEYGDDGRVVRANCVIPTTQNNANIHLDMRALVGQFAKEGMTDEKLELLCSMLVRAYDPCISCSVH
jgi:coenzyme F420-reducing hydrogenase alpha subunit